MLADLEKFGARQCWWIKKNKAAANVGGQNMTQSF
jgi:hypothetical protein